MAYEPNAEIRRILTLIDDANLETVIEHTYSTSRSGRVAREEKDRRQITAAVRAHGQKYGGSRFTLNQIEAAVSL